MKNEVGADWAVLKPVIVPVLLANLIWINASELFRYFAFVMPMMRQALPQVPNVAPMSLPIFLIWGVWDTILLLAVSSLAWLFLTRYGATIRNALISGTALWCTIFVIFWLGKVRRICDLLLRRFGRSGHMSEVSTCLWFGKDAESAVRFYVSIVPNSRIDRLQRSPASWPGGEAGDIILISFRLGGQSFQALYSGAPVDYGTAASISVQCADQTDLDRLWAALTADGGSEIMCGWLRDRWGIPWQIVPEVLPLLLADPDPAISARVFAAMQGMVKLDAAALERAAAG